ncbi:MAG: OmpH family outer membrane protein [Gammaproteobacteria bacterium]
MKLIVVCATVSLFGTSVALAADLKIGFVNIAKIMQEAPQAKSARELLEQEFSPRDAKLKAERDSILKLEEQKKKDGEIMSVAKRDELEKKILRRKREFNRAQDELQEDFNIRRNEELGRLQKRVHDVIVDVAKKDKFDLIVTERVLYASERIDITEQVLGQLKN